MPDSPTEQPLDGALEEISLGELNISNQANRALAEDAPPAIPIITKTLDLDTESPTESNCILGPESQVEEKKTKKKGVKKAQGKREDNNMPSINKCHSSHFNN